jgi:predicted glycoside hydrolase/deacetylase ChbG (UPF0249 family)
MAAPRSLVVVADDYGIGPETSRGILELACERRVTATVLLVNSPYAEPAVAAWRSADPPADLGWHPNLTLDFPVLPPAEVPSLVRPDGRFWPLGSFLLRSLTGRLSAAEVAAELRAQYRRFRELTGGPPAVVNSHQHVGLFPPVESPLREVLREQRRLPYLRRVVEPAATLLRVRGARLKRAVLSTFGRRAGRGIAVDGFPHCRNFAGLTNPAHVADPRFFARWLQTMPGDAVELMCHPGYRDETLIGRDAAADNEFVARRARELALLRAPDYPAAVRDAGFRLTRPGEITHPAVRDRTAA